MCQTRLSIRLNKHYDADLIQYLAGAKNKSRELRGVIRAGLKAMSDKTSDIAQGQQKNATKVTKWNFPK